MFMVSEFRQKEVVNLSNGKKLGYICDVEIDFNDAKIISVVVPGSSKTFNVFGRSDDMVIPWSKIVKIGDSVILVDV